jgi:hypothetical protein
MYGINNGSSRPGILVRGTWNIKNSVFINPGFRNPLFRNPLVGNLSVGTPFIGNH